MTTKKQSKCNGNVKQANANANATATAKAKAIRASLRSE
jgi:hypothetical protein